jgi:hypothetical protein
MIPTPSLFALPSRPMAIMAAGFEMDDLEVIWMWGERGERGEGGKEGFLAFLFQLDPAK